MRHSSPLCLCLPLVLTGCALTSTAPSVPETYSGVAITGVMHGGQAPVVGSHLYLLAANTTGYGGPGIAASTSNASSSLLTSNVETNNPLNYGFDGTNYYVTTDSNGAFTLTGDYTCTAGQQVYIYAVGGNPGSGANSASGEMAVLGNCPGTTFSSSLFVSLNEVSTVAAAYAFAGFATDATHVSSSGTTLALTGISNAFANAANLVDLPSGTALTTTPGGNGTVPQTTIYTIADILAACVNSTGSGSSGCATLFDNLGTAGATDTATAAIYLAHTPYPGSTQMTNLFGSPAPVSPFAPALSAQPNDWMIGLTFTGGGLLGNDPIAIDGAGNVWTSGNTNATNGPGYVVELSPTGAILSGTTGYTATGLIKATDIAIDPSGNIWVTNVQLVNGPTDTINAFTSSGTAIPGMYSTNNYGNVTYIAVSAAGIVFVANGQEDHLEEIKPNLTVVNYGGNDQISPKGVAIDGTGTIWTAEGNVDAIALVGPIDRTTVLTGGGLDGSASLAIDSSNQLWTANSTNNSISKFSSTAAISGSSGYTGGGLNDPTQIVIDGAGKAWVINLGANQLSEFTSAGVAITGSTGYTVPAKLPGLSTARRLALDGSGDIWVGDNSALTELIGAATPVVTPIVANLVSPYSAPASKP